ncbi:trypsin-4-like [Phlebotomus papatasi]|uniref:trypsin-4-like n=1 Tax=Phlebotomus papatasi TaxID=29031 RepID=UPI00248436F0|nr:trypsin-4-like [Phlebotomus papatasi]
MIRLSHIIILSALLVEVYNIPELSKDVRIVDGIDIEIEKVPYQVALLKSEDVLVCGGSIITRKHILTSAHCYRLVNVDELRVRTESEYYNEGGLLFKAKEFLLHPRFSEIEWECDVAIIKLESRLRYNKKCQPIELPRVNEEICDGLLFLLSGYGRTDAQAPHRDAKLRAVAVPAFNNGACYETYYYDSPISPRMLCAGYIAGGKNACFGDSGGPLVRNGVQYGIVSHGLGCAPPLYPGIYARIAAPLIREWITNITGLL